MGGKVLMQTVSLQKDLTGPDQVSDTSGCSPAQGTRLPQQRELSGTSAALTTSVVATRQQTALQMLQMPTPHPPTIQPALPKNSTVAWGRGVGVGPRVREQMGAENEQMISMP